MPLGEVDGEPRAFDIVDPPFQRLTRLAWHPSDEQGFRAVMRGVKRWRPVSSLERLSEQLEGGRNVATTNLEKAKVRRQNDDSVAQTILMRQCDATAKITLSRGE